MGEKGPEIRVEDVENDHGKLHANYNKNVPDKFIPNNLSGIHYGRQKIQREVSRLSKWN